MPLKLICEHARPNEQTFSQPVIKVGKLSSSHYKIEHDEVARMHAVIEREADGTYVIIDLGSHSGTRVNGKPAAKARIDNASIIELGKVVVHAYIEEAVEPVNPQEPSYSTVRHALQSLLESKNKMERETIIGEAGGGLVCVEFDGGYTPRRVFVDPLAMENAAMVEDLVLAALVDAQRKFQELAESLAKSAWKDFGNG
jgi:DNA-binding protein YbaB